MYRSPQKNFPIEKKIGPPNHIDVEEASNDNAID